MKAAAKADVPKANVSVAPELVKHFLKHVVEGEQDKAEAMLKQNKALALAANDVTDLSGGAFQGITGFQYAVWALDRHMWSMIEKYLDKEAVKSQLGGMENGNWINKHSNSADSKSLLKALDKQIELLKASKWDDAARLEEWGQTATILCNLGLTPFLFGSKITPFKSYQKKRGVTE